MSKRDPRPASGWQSLLRCTVVREPVRGGAPNQAHRALWANQRVRAPGRHSCPPCQERNANIQFQTAPMFRPWWWPFVYPVPGPPSLGMEYTRSSWAGTQESPAQVSPARIAVKCPPPYHCHVTRKKALPPLETKMPEDTQFARPDENARSTLRAALDWLWKEEWVCSLDDSGGNELPSGHIPAGRPAGCERDDGPSFSLCNG
ncbi:hypothetical protein VTK73DRAFT_8858 [Phialemonium thermophilum]|uniref:Uncharacterized protein n=1 Tax=Phialemonium thermophilum TaxID=223376 RepID=A0ABR3W5S6_9PEZI